MPLSNHALRRLAALGVNDEPALRFWDELWQSAGESHFFEFLQIEEKTAAEYRHWFPTLSAFAADCRRARPAPLVAELPITEQEQHRLLSVRMREYVASNNRGSVLFRRPHQAAILWTTRVGLAAAAEAFGGTGVIILDESEREQWFDEVYCPKDDDFWWYALAWWTVRAELPTEDVDRVRSLFPIPQGSRYWVLESGEIVGPLAGGAKHELWQWDGARAEFIDVYWVDAF